MNSGQTSRSNRCLTNLRPIFLGIVAWICTDAAFGLLTGLILVCQGHSDPAIAASYQGSEFWGPYVLATGLVSILIGGAVTGRCARTRWLIHSGGYGIAVVALLTLFRVIGFGCPSMLRIVLSLPLGLAGGTVVANLTRR